MREVWDASILWGTDSWVKQNSPNLMHTVGDQEWSQRLEQLALRNVRLAGGLLMPFPSATDRDFAQVNRAVAKASVGIARIAEPVYAFTPGNSRNAAELAELARLKPPGGIKLWPYMGGFHLDQLLLDHALVKALSDRRMLLLMHVGNGREYQSRPAFPDVRATPEVALRCAQELPDVTVVIAHMARLCPRTLEKVAATPNAYLDLSGLTSLGRWSEGGRDGLPVDEGFELAARGPAEILHDVVTQYGLADRILFGTTWPFCRWWGIDLVDDLQLVETSGLSLAAQEAILGGSLRKLLNRVDRVW